MIGWLMCEMMQHSASGAVDGGFRLVGVWDDGGGAY